MKKSAVISRRNVLAAAGFVMAAVVQPSVAASEELTKVTLRLNYVPNAEHAPYYVGLKKGFYEDAGLDIEILPGSGSNDTVRLVGAGNDMFGVAVADAVVTGRGRGAPIVSLAVLLQQSPNVMVSLKANGILEPTDLYGRSVGVPSRSTVFAFWQALISAANLDEGQIETVDLGTTPTSGVLVSGGIDAAITLATNEKVALEQRGVELNVIDMAEYGVRSYGQTLFANEDLVANEPELAKRMREATLASWQYTIENTQEAIEILREYVPETNVEHELAKWEEIIPRTRSADGEVAFGHQDEAGWRLTYDTFAAADLIGTPFDPADLMAKYE